MRRFENRGQSELTERKFNLVLSMVACFVAVEAGALVVCTGIMVLEGGLFASLDGIAVWAFAQPVILFIALGSMPLGALLRMVLGLAFEQPLSVALIAGGMVGLVGSALFAFFTNDGLFAWVRAMPLGLVAGVVGGWTWWRIEKPFLDR
ncbi:hypothetical protein [uncultured Roseovarius sp.]|uniref:hypothetical protein n=1 Tax=uncultured Roseovarius sp. TaxID=293344 RepID=UPI002630DC2F|nr:hypothetical protein [uncultured Roseovarius sp.]